MKIAFKNHCNAVSKKYYQKIHRCRTAGDCGTGLAAIQAVLSEL